jgi:hypothetical protein
MRDLGCLKCVLRPRLTRVAGFPVSPVGNCKMVPECVARSDRKGVSRAHSIAVTIVVRRSCGHYRAESCMRQPIRQIFPL